MAPVNRRQFNRRLGKGLLGTIALGSLPLNSVMASCSYPQRKLGIALVGLGSYSTYQLAPALQQTQYCRLTGIVTGTPETLSIHKGLQKMDRVVIYLLPVFGNLLGDLTQDMGSQMGHPDPR